MKQVAPCPFLDKSILDGPHLKVRPKNQPGTSEVNKNSVGLFVEAPRPLRYTTWNAGGRFLFLPLFRVKMEEILNFLGILLVEGKMQEIELTCPKNLKQLKSFGTFTEYGPTWETHV